MGALTDEQRRIVNGCFELRSFTEMFPIIDQEYKRLGLGDNLDDEERISEYQYINQQLRKFAFSKQDQILDHGSDLDGMLQEIGSLLSNAPEYASTRKNLVYNFMRDQWVAELYANISYLLDNVEEEEDE